MTFGAWGLSTLIFSTVSEITGPNSGAVTIWGFTMVVSLLVAAFIAAPLVFAGLAAATTALILPGTGVALSAILAVVVGMAAGLGRAAIIRDVNP
ncbi:hypothetical protein [Arthrobacter sp. TMN-50]